MILIVITANLLCLIGAHEEYKRGKGGLWRALLLLLIPASTIGGIIASVVLPYLSKHTL